MIAMDDQSAPMSPAHRKLMARILMANADDPKKVGLDKIASMALQGFMMGGPDSKAGIMAPLGMGSSQGGGQFFGANGLPALPVPGPSFSIPSPNAGGLLPWS
jgi:hypothetical protein